jgi:hypothetical protein
LLSFVPIIPLGWQDLNTPEGTSMHANSGSWPNFKPTEDFAKALAEDLKNTGIFSDAFFDYRIGNAEYAVKGKIMSTKYKSRIVTYGLGLYGGILWFIGLPATWTENELAVNLSLVDSKTDHNLFSKDYVAIPRKETSWAYHFKSDFEYAEMLAELNKQFCTDIEPFLEKVAKDSKTNSVTSDK